MSKDYYKTLGVDKKANKDEIKKAFYKLAHLHHPDKNAGNDTKFKEVNEAYQTLNDDKKRAQYDQFGSAGQHGGAHGASQGGFGGFEGFDFSGFGGQNSGFEFDMGDMFDMFGGNRGGGRQRSRRGEDLQILIQVTIAESFLGVNKKVTYNRHVKCETCSGDGAKPGTKKHECKKCSGKGVVNIAKKTIFGTFQQQGLCDECEGEGKVPEVRCSVCKGQGLQMKKEEVSVPIKEGVENGQQLMMRGYGEGVASGESGDLYITIRVAKPKSLSKRAKELLEELKAEGY